MKKTYSIPCNTIAFLIEAAYDLQETPDRNVVYTIYRSDHARQRQEGSLLHPGDIGHFKLEYADSINAKGSLHIFAASGGQLFLFVDILYGQNLPEHFEGNVFALD